MNMENLTSLCKDIDLEEADLLMREVLVINSDTASPKLGLCQRKVANLYFKSTC